VNDIRWGFFACAAMLDKMISSPRKHMLRQLSMLPLDFIAPKPICIYGRSMRDLYL
jgi:hypothetical protein